MNIENLSDNEIKNMEAEIKARREEVKPTYQHYGSAENLSANEIASMEAEVRARREEVKPTYQHYGSVENLSSNEIASMEAEVRARREEVRPTYQHYGSAENLNDNEIASMEAEIRARREEVKPTYQHYGSAENLSDNDIRTMEAQVAEKRKQDIPYKEYLNNLITNPNISDNNQFEDAVIRSMESNGIMRDFTTNLVEEISKATYEFKNIEKTDVVNIQKQKQRVENLMNVYIRYLYELKSHEWTFSGAGNNIGLEMISSEMLEDLWRVQKQFDLTFNMPIPKNLGEYYGQSFERQGKMIPGITLMYDDLKNKEVNWHQVLIYKENELTPRQRYMQKKEEALKQFDLARQEEIKNTLAYAHSKTQVNKSLENEEQLDTVSIRR